MALVAHPAAEPPALHDALKSAIADRGSPVEWDVDRIGRRVDLLSPGRERFRGGTLEEAVAWRLLRSMVLAWGVGAFA